ncbi:hypothetical protein A2526_02420 [candidate division WOR-1 bacterium RIFOXYD2_FULL_36_8]|nr:MAG: hypothetical protein A2526_02420 [candidate division WOR-1 bacterium RIFOXYD2_FULL_36_8]
MFSGSKKEFEAYSRKIRKLTKKIWKLNVNFPQIGMDWIHKKLETLALESAKYKLELLKSMQKVAYDPANEVTIHWLETTIAHF